MSELVYLSAREMLSKLYRGDVSAQDLLEAHLDRFCQTHTTYNAVVDTDLESARKQAKALDDARLRGEELGALAGIPMTVKDTYDVDGMPAASGNPKYKTRERKCRNADLVQVVKDAGAITWGKTNVPYLASDFQSYNEVYGTTNNPYDVSRTPGGSSGGAAAALALGITPLEIGSDIGGSLRHPASFCGVIALKPTWGVLPMAGHVPEHPGSYVDQIDLAVCGPMARNVADTELLWRVLTNTHHRKQPREIRGAKVALIVEQDGFVLSNEVKSHVERGAKVLEQHGAIIEQISPFDLRELFEHYWVIVNSIVVKSDPESFLKPVYEAKLQVQNFKNQLARFFFEEGFEAIVMPVDPVPAIKHDHRPFAERQIEIDGQHFPYFQMLNWISLANILNVPSLAVQAGQSREGLPIGIQIVGPWRKEDRLFDLGYVLEEAYGFIKPKL